MTLSAAARRLTQLFEATETLENASPEASEMRQERFLHVVDILWILNRSACKKGDMGWPKLDIANVRGVGADVRGAV